VNPSSHSRPRSRASAAGTALRGWRSVHAGRSDPAGTWSRRSPTPKTLASPGAPGARHPRDAPVHGSGDPCTRAREEQQAPVPLHDVTQGPPPLTSGSPTTPAPPPRHPARHNPQMQQESHNFRDATLVGLSGLHSEEPPLVRDALELVRAAVFEHDAGPRHQIPHRARHEHFARAGEGREPGADVNGDPADAASRARWPRCSRPQC